MLVLILFHALPWLIIDAVPLSRAAVDIIVVRTTSSVPLPGAMVAAALVEIGVREEIARTSGIEVRDVTAPEDNGVIAGGIGGGGTQAPVAVSESTMNTIIDT